MLVLLLKKERMVYECGLAVKAFSECRCSHPSSLDTVALSVLPQYRNNTKLLKILGRMFLFNLPLSMTLSQIGHVCMLDALLVVPRVESRMSYFCWSREVSNPLNWVGSPMAGLQFSLERSS